ncbi:hypothetical protein ACSLBF_12490 [Pseudoalteromonas sp. T1lg65]|uniref:hypothetical protein n=1 Tax=Pseudoalteromonas sp. T1lg65 TaxID=2077101 RepID=UPI003F79051F
MKYISLASILVLLLACHHQSEVSYPWNINSNGITYKGELQNLESALTVNCDTCKVEKKSLIRPSGPSEYVLVSDSEQLKAIWGKNSTAAIYLPNRVGKKLINLAADTESGSWLMGIDENPKLLKEGRVNELVLEDTIYRVLINSQVAENAFTYSVLIE